MASSLCCLNTMINGTLRATSAAALQEPQVIHSVSQMEFIVSYQQLILKHTPYKGVHYCHLRFLFLPSFHIVQSQVDVWRAPVLFPVAKISLIHGSTVGNIYYPWVSPWASPEANIGYMSYIKSTCCFLHSITVLSYIFESNKNIKFRKILLGWLRHGTSYIIQA